MLSRIGAWALHISSIGGALLEVECGGSVETECFFLQVHSLPEQPESLNQNPEPSVGWGGA